MHFPCLHAPLSPTNKMRTEIKDSQVNDFYPPSIKSIFLPIKTLYKIATRPISFMLALALAHAHTPSHSHAHTQNSLIFINLLVLLSQAQLHKKFPLEFNFPALHQISLTLVLTENATNTLECTHRFHRKRETNTMYAVVIL